MSRKLIIAMAVLSFAFAGATFAAVENIKVSGDISSEVVIRSLDLGAATVKDSEDFLFTQVRLRFDADLTEGVSAVISLINERLWGLETDADTDLDLDLAYIELKEFLYDPLTLIVGRQNLRYGNALIIGDPDTNRVVSGAGPAAIADLSLRKSFDAVRGILDFAPWTIDLVYALVDEDSTSVHDDISIVGINAAYDWASYNGITEGYLWYAATRTGVQVPENEDKTIVIGGRVQFDPNDNLVLGLEGAVQFGDADAIAVGTDTNREAFAIQFNSEYKFLNDYNTKIGFGYTYLSGDNNTSDSDNNAWDSLFESQTPAEIINILSANTNAQYFTVSTSIMPQEDITLGLLYTHARLAKEYTSTTLTDTARSAIESNSYSVKTNDKHFGDEIDIYAIYDYTEDVQLKLTGAWFIPGGVFENANDSTAYSIRGGLVVSF